MDVRQITKAFAVSDQLTAKDVGQAHAMGYATILCMRPDGEDAGQPLFESIEAAAKATRIAARYLPVPASGPREADVKAFATLYAELPKPVLAYCRSGGRALATYHRAFPKAA